MGDTTIREAVGVFHDERSLQAAVDALLISGFDRSQLSLLGGQRALRSKMGLHHRNVVELEDDPAVPKRAYVGIDSRTEAKAAIVGGLFYVGAVAATGLIVASGGTVTATLVAGAAAGGGGGLIGGALVLLLEHRHAHELQAQLDRGGLLLWVHTPRPENERSAMDILRAHGADDVHVHDQPVDADMNAAVASGGMIFKRLGI